MKDPSPRVRTTIAQTIAADARWMALSDTAAAAGSASSASDPDAGGVAGRAGSAAALTHARAERGADRACRGSGGRATWRRSTGSATSRSDGSASSAGRCCRRSCGRRRRSSQPPPTDRAVRVLAFGDFGTGSGAQKALGETIAAYHATPPLRSRHHPRRQLLQRRHGKPGRPAMADAVGRAVRSARHHLLRRAGQSRLGTSRQPRGRDPVFREERRRGACRASYYTFTAGPVQFFALDTQSVALAEQAAWRGWTASCRAARRDGRWCTAIMRSIRAASTRIARISQKLLPMLRNAPTSISAATITTCRRSSRRAACGTTSPAAAARDSTSCAIRALDLREPNERVRGNRRGRHAAHGSPGRRQRRDDLHGYDQEGPGDGIRAAALIVMSPSNQ